MALTRKEEQTFRDLMAAACEGDPRFATRVSGQRWRRFKVRRVTLAIVCFAVACLVLGLGSTAPAWVAGGVLFTVGAGTLIKPLLVGHLPNVSWAKVGGGIARPFLRMAGWFRGLPRHLPRHLPLVHRRAS